MDLEKFARTSYWLVGTVGWLTLMFFIVFVAWKTK